MNLKGAIFDLDGTLLDSMPLWDHVGEDYLREQGITPEEGLKERFIAMSLFQAAQYFQEHYRVPYTEDEISDQINALIERYYRYELPLKPHAAEFLQKLGKAGVKMCVATATDRHLVEAALKRLGIADHFQCIFTCSEVGCGKDEPIIFHKALETLGTGLEDTYVFEDALYAIRTAKAAGFHIAGVYDAASAADENHIRELADRYMHTLEEWEECL